MQSNRVGWRTHNWWLLIFLFVYLQIIKSMRRVGMCEKNCRLSSLKLDCLSKKKHSLAAWNHSGLNPDLKVKHRRLDLKRRGSSADYRSKLSFPKSKGTRNSFLQCSPIVVRVSNLSDLSVGSLVTNLLNFLSSCYFTKCSEDFPRAQLCRKHLETFVREISPK